MRHGLRLLAAAILTMASTAQAQEDWTLGPEKRLPAFRRQERMPGKEAKLWDFRLGLDGWKPRSKTVKLSHDPASGRQAPGCLRVRGLDEGNWNFVWSPNFHVGAGKGYRVTMWLRVESVPKRAPAAYCFKVEMFKSGGGGERVLSNSVQTKVSGEWQETSLEFIAPKGGLDHVALALEKGGRARADVDVSIDDVLVEEIPRDMLEQVWRDAALRGPITKELRGVHPRLYLNAERLAFLRGAVKEDERWKAMNAELIRLADAAVRRPPPDYAEQMKRYKKGTPAGSHEQLWQRGVGNRIPHIALAYLLTGDKRYLAAAKTWVFAALDYPTWGIGSMEGMDLAAGHVMAGVGLAYDWLYHDLSPEERQRIRELVTPRAEKLARAGYEKRPFWHSAYMQNHLWVSLGGMCTIAFAMADEVPEAASWICFAHGKFVRTLELLGDDGASHEGYGYWEYGAEYIMRYLEMADTCLGIDLYFDSHSRPHPWLSRNAAYALHLSLPRAMWTRRRSVVDLADCPRNHWYGPSHLLRNLARRYPESPWRGMAQWLAAEIQGAGIDATSSGHYLNFAWCDGSIPTRSPQDAGLPLHHHFPDLGIVSARTSWAGDATLLVLKCGPPLGHRHADGGKAYGAGHVHPDAGHFLLAAGGETLFRDSGYTHLKLAGNHSTLLVDGRGQKGEGQKWFDYRPWLKDRRAPRISRCEFTPGRDVIQCDAAPAYPLDVGLKRFDRQFDFVHPDKLVIRDAIETESPADLEWRFQVEGTLHRLSDLEWRTTQAKVSATIRVEATVPIASDVGTLEVDSHIRPRQRSYLSVKTKSKTGAAQLTTCIQVTDRP